MITTAVFVLVFIILIAYSGRLRTLEREVTALQGKKEPQP